MANAAIDTNFEQPQRIAPKAGYSTAEKARYRTLVWDGIIASGLTFSGPSDKFVIMPSSEGLEIDEALSRGVHLSNILCVDRSPAVVATSKWRKKYPDLSWLCCDVSNSPAIAEKRGWRVVGGNLDLCGNFSDETVSTVKTFCDYLIARGIDPVIGVTIARGRESKALGFFLGEKEGSAFKCRRIQALVSVALNCPSELIADGLYVSGKHPMSWVVLKVENALFQEFLSIIENLPHNYVTADALIFAEMPPSAFSIDKRGHFERLLWERELWRNCVCLTKQDFHVKACYCGAWDCYEQYDQTKNGDLWAGNKRYWRDHNFYFDGMFTSEGEPIQRVSLKDCQYDEWAEAFQIPTGKTFLTHLTYFRRAWLKELCVAAYKFYQLHGEHSPNHHRKICFLQSGGGRKPQIKRAVIKVHTEDMPDIVRLMQSASD